MIFDSLFKKKTKSAKYEYAPNTQEPVIHASICNGEQVAGFKDKRTGEFHEVMLIRGQKDLSDFMKAYGLDHVEKEY